MEKRKDERGERGQILVHAKYRVPLYRRSHMYGIHELLFAFTHRTFILLFFSEISNFLSDSECEHIKDLAKKNGLKESVAGFEEQVYKGEIEDALKQSGVLHTAKNARDLLQVATWPLVVPLVVHKIV